MQLGLLTFALRFRDNRSLLEESCNTMRVYIWSSSHVFKIPG